MFTRSLDLLPDVSLAAEKEDDDSVEGEANGDKIYDVTVDHGGPAGSRVGSLLTARFQDLRLRSRSLDSLLRPEDLHGEPATNAAYEQELLSKLSSHMHKLEK
jgi:hypothetical protein